MKYTTSILVTLFALASNQVFAQDFDLDASIKRGSSIYSSKCASCHMTHGKGINGVYPSLAGADSLVHDIPRMVNSIIKGDHAPTDVEYAEVSHSFSLTDQEASDLINYIRNSWGNEGEAILPVDIQTALKKTEEYD